MYVHIDGSPLGSQIASVVATARAAWPGIDVPSARFAGYLTERLPADIEIETALRTIHASDLYLACACVDGDATAIAAFDREVLTVIDRALARLGMDADTVTEVKQRLRSALLIADRRPPGIAAFTGRGRLRNWVRIASVRDALAIERRMRRDLATEDKLVELVAAGATPELEYLKRLYRREFELAFRDAVHALSDRERALVKLHFLDRVAIRDIARLYRVHRATAGRWLDGARDALLKTTRARMQDRLHVQPAELDSILRLVLSHLEISLRTWFRGRG